MFPGGGGGHGDGDGAAGKMAMQLVERTEPGDIDAIVNCGGGGGRPDRWGSPSDDRSLGRYWQNLHPRKA